MLRCDNQGKISKIEELPNGFLKIKGTLAKVGWLKYHTDNGIRWEYVSEKTLFDPVHLDSIEGAPLTLKHPPSPVNPSNYQEYSVGTGIKIFPNKAKKTIELTTVICADKAIEAVKSGTKGLSMGYSCDVLRRDSLEERYDQYNRFCNHNAIVLYPRTEGAGLNLDGYEQGEEEVSKLLDTSNTIKSVRIFI